MSARLLKRVLKEQELQKQQQQQEEEEEEEESSPPKTTSSFVNPFDLLNEGDDDDDDEEEEEEDHEAQQEGDLKLDNGTAGGHSEKKNPAPVKGTASVVASSNKKSKKKKKKKKKNKEDSAWNSSKVEEPLEAILEDLSIDANSSRQRSGPLNSKNTKPEHHDNLIEQSAPAILQVDPKFLNADNELRRIFGSKVVKSFENSHHAGSSRQVRAGRRGAHIPRKTTLVTPPEHWSRWDGSLSMEFLESRNGQNYFRYVQTPSYSQAQSSFEAVKHMHDLNGIASILMYNPYHLDSLMAMAEYFKLVGEHQTSADAIAKCLYALECAWHPMFTPFQGNCQLKFSHDTNKPLFTTLFMHLKNMDRRGCHRSALEVCKLLLSLDSDDPMGALFYIDYLSLRAEEYAWLEEFSEHYSSDSSLWLFPNFSYSLAICRFYLEQESSKDSQLDEKATSVDLMKQALMLHPSVLKKLVAKTPLKDQAWTRLLRHSFFKSDQTGSETLDHLINIYVERNYIIWRLPNVQKLLRESAQLVIEEIEQNGTVAKDWACVRKEAFSSENNEYSHLVVSDFSDTVPTMPPEILQNFMVDARMREGVHFENQAADPLDGAPAPRDVANRNPLAVLFESMLPWVHYGDGDGGDEGADGDNQPNIPDQGNQG